MKKKAGFTLIEFMVAMAVTLVVMTAVVAAFRDATRANQGVAAREDMADNLRAGLNLISQDLLQAGTGIPTGGISIPAFAANAGCPNGASNLNRPILTGATTFPQCNLFLPAVEPGSNMGPFITSPDATSNVNTDIITVLYQDNLSTSGTYLVGMDATPINGTSCPSGAITAAGDKVTFDSNCFNLGTLAASGVSLNPGDLILFSNANGNALQTITSISGQTLSFASGDAFNLNGVVGSTGGTIRQIQNYTIDLSGNKLFNVGTYPPTTATRIWMVSYYLDNVTDPAHVRLIRRVNFNPGLPVGETLENLQFTYNFNDGKTSNQVTVPVGFSENQIRSVNIYLGTRSTNMIPGINRYLRENFQTQVTLRSMAYRNLYPGS
jgi:prepilin-type N-terminal cleavage/methylation domain-containing protein